jgi:DNA mismatch repair ATPase MutS
MKQFITSHGNKPTYSKFCEDIQTHSNVLKEYYDMLHNIEPSNYLISKIGNVGYMLQCYYELHSNQRYEYSIRYSFGFEGFIDNIRGVSRNCSDGHISPATFDKTKSCKFKKQYYPSHMEETKCIKNNCDLDKNLIITGPNASGKTTLLKSTTINVICSQQLGYGFYASAVINPYTHIHSYINIPDTSERDSLFQAESRRCKEIIDSINSNLIDDGCRHYCIIDELYSGTNPDEATKSGIAFLKYLSKYDNVDFILTTHYNKICTKLRKHNSIRNHKMDVIQEDNGKLKFTYKMKKGISKIQGAAFILEDMDYPEEIINQIKGIK